MKKINTNELEWDTWSSPKGTFVASGKEVSHSAQWEFYHVISGKGSVRHKDGKTAIAAGDAFIFPPGEPHQLVNDGAEDLTMYVVADNPIGETHYYPDSNKWGVGIPERRLLRSENLDYFDGEE